jgi:hypothetical protein
LGENTIRENGSDSLGAWIISSIKDFIGQSSENTIQNAAQEKAFENPLVRFSSGADPLCEKHTKKTAAVYVKDHYGFEGFGCDLCQTGVPRESLIPVRQKTESSS